MRAFLLSLICFLAFYPTPILAQAPSCGGADLLTRLKNADPATYARLQVRAAETPNHEGRMWRIEAEGSAPSFLFGTIHRSDSRLTDLPEALLDAIASADTVLLEVTQADSKAFEAKMASNPALVMAGAGPFFDDGFTEAQKAMAEGVLASYGLPYQHVRLMKPALVMTMVGFSPCILARMQTGLAVVDEVIEQLGAQAGAEVLALETPMEQWEAFERLTDAALTDIMIASFAMADQADDFHETMLNAYLRDEMILYWEFSVFAAEQQGLALNADAALETFWRELLVKRNHTMANRAEPYLKKGGAVVAVGGLHLPGEEGLVELLRQRGFNVTRVQ